MTEVVHFQRKGMAFEPGTIGSGNEGPGTAGYARLIGPKLSKSMGAGIASYDRCRVEWTLLYDEIIVVLEGLFRMRHGKGLEHLIEASPGDVIWLANGTHMTYEGDDAVIFYAVDPVDWRSKHGYPE